MLAHIFVVLYTLITMVLFLIHGYNVLVMLPLEEFGSDVLQEHLLCTEFNFWIGSMYVEHEIHSNESNLDEVVLFVKSRDDDWGVWTLMSGKCRVFGLCDPEIQVSIVMMTPTSDTTIMQFFHQVFVKIKPEQVLVTILRASKINIISAITLATLLHSQFAAWHLLFAIRLKGLYLLYVPCLATVDSLLRNSHLHDAFWNDIARCLEEDFQKVLVWINFGRHWFRYH